MNKFNLKVKLLCLLALPIAGVLLFGVIGALDRKQKADTCTALTVNSTLLQQLGMVAHELQRERGRSAVFIGSKGSKFADELTAQQQQTDTQTRRLDELLSGFSTSALGADFVAALDAAVKALAELPAKRTSIRSLSIAGPDSTAYFTATIGKLLQVDVKLSQIVSEHRIARAMAAYVNFLQAKEQTGIERAVMATVFSNDKFQGEALTRFNRAVASQETFMNVFRNSATPEHLSLYTETVRGTPVDDVERMRQTAVAKAESGGFNIPANSWFDAITAKMELMKKVEDRLSTDCISMAAGTAADARRAFLVFSAGIIAIFAFTLILGVRTIIGITSPLKKAINDLSFGSSTVTSASGQITASSQTLAQGASEQAASLEETSAALEELTSMVKRNSESAQQAKDLSTQTRSAADASAVGVDRMREAMEAIKGSNSDVAKIIKSIDEIAFQTNILALNAAVEAARAGEAGAGFSVVAEEVRNLAQRSALAARETAEKIDDAISKTAQGVQVTSTVADTLQDIIAKARQVDDLVGQIATASREQSDGITQVNLAVTQMDKVTQSNAASAEESASASEELNAQAQSMKETVVELAALVGGAAPQRTTDRRSTAVDPATASQPKRILTTTPRINVTATAHTESATKADARETLSF